MVAGPPHKMENKVIWAQDNVIIGPKITELKEITDLNRRMGPPVNKITHYVYLEATSLPS
jgi:hypothetical protein